MPTQMQTPMPGFSATDAIFNFPDSVVARLRPFFKGNQACPVGVPNLTPGCYPLARGDSRSRRAGGSRSSSKRESVTAAAAAEGGSRSRSAGGSQRARGSRSRAPTPARGRSNSKSRHQDHRGRFGSDQQDRKWGQVAHSVWKSEH